MAIVDPARSSLPATNRPTAVLGSIPGARLVPGLLLCGAVTLAALGLERVEAGLFGHAWLEALVLAILVGALVRTLWSPSQRWTPGIAFGAKTLLEIAVVLLGASVSVGAIVSAGPLLLVGIAAVVVIAIAASYGLGRLLGLPHRMAVLVACGNSICGNSAIAAVAPVIGADGKEVAASIAFTAVLGVLVVLGLPFLPALMQISEVQYGVLAGLTVYAVPQVLAATAPIGAIALQLGTLVKLVRVLMLGPMILVLTLVTRHRNEGSASTSGRMPWHKLVPWFIDGFLLLAVLRSFGLLPEAVLAPAATAATWLTVLSMAALGLSTDLGSVARAGGRVTAAVTLSLLVLGAISFGLIRLLGIV
ncbi:YeiH family protein [Inquilinus sp. Marseille-Q2685]|uniref:YeiH family protein n=1 Tax=Inquilinus sp. Marseille-Q2685 TaxID=2866581 RepID=UPI001CE4B084|nr:putative sulfate exporter family transporter [Inquilinus sp. Marseille-Q2685]